MTEITDRIISRLPPAEEPEQRLPKVDDTGRGHRAPARNVPFGAAPEVRSGP
jgi:hypothetical protein